MNHTDPFLTNIFSKLQQLKMSVDHLYLDHIAWCADTNQAYEQKKNEFASLGKLVSEEIIGGRRAAISELATALMWQTRAIPALEVIEPKPDQIIKNGWDHAEFVLDVPFEAFMRTYPTLPWDTSSLSRPEFPHLKLPLGDGLQVKFHHTPILEMVKKGK